MIWNFIKDLFFSKKINLSAFGRTDTGRKRARNEDSFATITNQNLFLVADGMGGHKAGDIASQNAVNILADYLLEKDLIKMSGNQVEIRHTLISGFIHTNQAIMDMSSSNDELADMGCTMIACFVDLDHIHFCHIGDVRGYVSDGDSFNQQTTDHTFAAKSSSKSNNETALQKVPPKNIVSQAIGFPFNDGPEYNSAKSKHDSRVLICSDGLWGMLKDEKLKSIIESCNSPEQACDQFIENANESGGKDNITAVTIFLHEKIKTSYLR